MSEQAGDYNRLILVRKAQTTLDAANHPVKGWIIHKRKWARIVGQTGMGSLNAAASTGTGVSGAQVGYSFRLLGMDDSITQDMTVEYKGAIFEIITVAHDYAGKEYTDLVVVAGGGRG